ncbi:hypothetical protein PVAR5_2440 [Paecilomyces variotii No. 5]|uniref:Uncharacterized protein n=1 Tax=Byssochlamys spectabilis (strain No. 5 / NBRC 109023) TaxID=1356009 RepID=V5FB58_BYSSN|nr:hypothetical protein PVAR5_2440 [Paecilomyces variotii No. 5]
MRGEQRMSCLVCESVSDEDDQQWLMDVADDDGDDGGDDGDAFKPSAFTARLDASLGISRVRLEGFVLLLHAQPPTSTTPCSISNHARRFYHPARSISLLAGSIANPAVQPSEPHPGVRLHANTSVRDEGKRLMSPATCVSSR